MTLPCTVRTFREGSCNQKVGCLEWLGSNAFEPAKWSDSTVSKSGFLSKILYNLRCTSYSFFSVEFLF